MLLQLQDAKLRGCHKRAIKTATATFPGYSYPENHTLMSRNVRSTVNGRFDDISSNRVNVHRFDDFGEFQS